VVLTHGWPDDVHCWDAVVGTLVEAGYRVYTPYLRGFGPTRFRRQETIRSGQIGALGRDLYDLLEGLDLHDVVLAGHDWGARASYVASVLVPERVRGLVALSVGYGSTSLDAPISFEQARAYWYQWFFATPKGRRTLEHDRPALCRHRQPRRRSCGWRRSSPSLLTGRVESPPGHQPLASSSSWWAAARRARPSSISASARANSSSSWLSSSSSRPPAIIWTSSSRLSSALLNVP